MGYLSTVSVVYFRSLFLHSCHLWVKDQLLSKLLKEVWKGNEGRLEHSENTDKITLFPLTGRVKPSLKSFRTPEKTQQLNSEECSEEGMVDYHLVSTVFLLATDLTVEINKRSQNQTFNANGIILNGKATLFWQSCVTSQIPAVRGLCLVHFFLLEQVLFPVNRKLSIAPIFSSLPLSSGL